jgi:hypothetical protein
LSVAITAADPVGCVGSPAAAISGAAKGAAAATARPLRIDRRSDEIVLIRCILAPAQLRGEQSNGRRCGNDGTVTVQ